MCCLYSMSTSQEVTHGSWLDFCSAYVSEVSKIGTTFQTGGYCKICCYLINTYISLSKLQWIPRTRECQPEIQMKHVHHCLKGLQIQIGSTCKMRAREQHLQTSYTGSIHSAMAILMPSPSTRDAICSRPKQVVMKIRRMTIHSTFSSCDADC